MINKEIARIFREISEYLEMQEDSFRSKAYARVSRTMEETQEDVVQIYERGGKKEIENLPGVGKSIAEKIEEYIKTGRIAYFEELKQKEPIDISSLTAVEGLGPKKIKKLYNELGIKTLNELEVAAKEGKIRKLADFGDKTEQNIIKGIQFLKQSGNRLLLGSAYIIAEEIIAKIKQCKGIEQVGVAGSARRMKETIGDIDILAMIEKPEDASAVMESFVSLPEVINIYSKGATKSSIRLKEGMNVDLRILSQKSYGAGLMYFTGSKDHNIEIRKVAAKQGLKLNEYGLFRGNKQVAGDSEEQIYEYLGLQFIPPEMRENTGEIKAAMDNKLPRLIKEEDIMGDLQIQTNWTDGEHAIMDYAEAAIKKGWQYILITDHSKRLAMVGGLDEKRLREQGKEIDAVNKILANKGYNFKVLKGIECDIIKDGELDLADDALAELDIVGAAVHSYLNLPAALQTERMLKAMENRYVNIIFHPTARIINQRRAMELQMDLVIEAAFKSGIALEINAYPDRLDLKDEYIRKCVEKGVKLVINSDAHSVRHMDYLKFGVAQARRGWAKREDVANAWPIDKLFKKLKNDRKR